MEQLMTKMQTAIPAPQTVQKKKRSKILVLLFAAAMLPGLLILSYPHIRVWWNTVEASRAIAAYDQAVGSLPAQRRQELLDAAAQYNDALEEGTNFILSEDDYAAYEDILDFTGTGMIGYIQIPSIQVSQPIYHGTGEEILQKAVGHIAGSSFPVGGGRTHSVLAGHRGLPTADLFVHLDQLKEGDTFTVHVLGKTTVYQVDQTTVVLPSEIEDLAITEHADYCTLVTCTPPGLDTHRLLVRGHLMK